MHPARNGEIVVDTVAATWDKRGGQIAPVGICVPAVSVIGNRYLKAQPVGTRRVVVRESSHESIQLHNVDHMIYDISQSLSKYPRRLQDDDGTAEMSQRILFPQTFSAGA
jgi:hypothetical protein